MKYIKLTLWTDEPENRYSHVIGVDDKDFAKAKKIIEKINDPHKMPDIRTIQDEYLMSDEIDFVLEALDRAKIAHHLLPDMEEFSIGEGVATKEEADSVLDSVSKPEHKKGK